MLNIIAYYNIYQYKDPKSKLDKPKHAFALRLVDNLISMNHTQGTTSCEILWYELMYSTWHNPPDQITFVIKSIKHYLA